jgi:hypothetical protein
MTHHQEYYHKESNDKTGHKEVEYPPKDLGRAPETIVGKRPTHKSTARFTTSPKT